MRGPRVTVYVGTSPLLRFRLKKPDGNKPGGTVPYVIIGASNTFNIKNDPDSTTAIYSYTSAAGEITIVDDGSEPLDKYSEVEVSLGRGVPSPGNYYYHIGVTIAGSIDIVSDGIFEVVNV